jgi:hypothetical protein
MAQPVVLPAIPLNTQEQGLTPIDTSAINTYIITRQFDTTKDSIVGYLYDNNDNFIRRIQVNYTVLGGNTEDTSTTQVTLDPVQDLAQNGYTQGSYKITYLFVTPLIDTNPLYYIQQISSDRTELRIIDPKMSTAELQKTTTTLQQYLNSTETFQGYYLDFGGDNTPLAVNTGFDSNTVTVKLYQPLPDSLSTGNAFYFTGKISEPVAYSIEYPLEEQAIDTSIYLRGPNLNLQIQQEVNNSTEFKSLDTLITSSTTLADQLNSLLIEKRAELNTDFSDYSNFVFFSSAQQRLSNFYYKAAQIENYNNQITILNALTYTPEISASIATYRANIKQITQNFDSYDYFLYYESSSQAWPKSNSTKPYTLYSTGSSQVLNWIGSADVTSPYFGGLILTASNYDLENQNNIYNIYPEYIKDDDDNANFQLFNEMVGQMFDQIWLYTKAIENRQDGDNSLSGGISIDLVADALRSYGVTLYESNFSNTDLYTTFLGITPGGSTLPPTGSELITSYVTASADTTPFNEAQKLIYKRLYHNLPYLLKKKGTVSGLRLLLNCFGIPDTIIRINEFGGKDKNVNTWDSWQNEFNYAYYTSGSSFVTASFTLNSAWGASSNKPQALEFRFKTDGLPQNTNTIASQSLWLTDTGVNIKLIYTGSGYVSGSYTGSVVNPYNQYATLEFYPEQASTTSASIYLPFYDGGWWSILVNRTTTGQYTLYAGNKIYQGVDGNILGFQASSSVTAVGLDTDWTTGTISTFGSASYKVFTGSFQEIRYYTQPISKSTFDAYVMNPYSIEQSEYLAFRATLGGELYTGSASVHPRVTGAWVTTSSFTSNSNFYVKPGGQYNTNTEYIYFDQVPAGIQNPISNKIRTSETILPPESDTNIPNNKTLSAFISVQQKAEASESVTRDVNYVEIALSPQNEINEDINATFGYFNLGEYIGDPRQISSSLTYYPELENLSEAYFEKYTGPYNWSDYNRLAKYFDNSIFRMLKDFIPARAGVAAGIVIKQHLLERNRQRPAQVSYIQPEYTASVTSLARDYKTGSIEVFTGGPGGAVDTWLNLSQSWSSSIDTKAGIVNTINSSKYEFFNGEYSGSMIDVVEGKLQDNPLLGADFRVGIPDLQNLNVNSTAFIISASYFDGSIYSTSGSIKFNTLNIVIPYYNTTTYQYKPNYSVQQDILVTITGSIISGSQENGTIGVTLEENGVVIGSTSYNTLTSAEVETFTISISIPNYYVTSGSTYEVKYSLTNDFPLPGTSASINANTKWTATVDNLAAQSTYYTDPTVYTQQNFPGNINEYSDYNTLLNNAYSNRVSTQYFDVDYSTDGYRPVNYGLIISQSAIYAQVQDSNYTPGSSWFTSRYEGTNNTGQYNYTASFASSSTPQGFPIDSFADYFLYYDTIETSAPEYPGGGNIHGIYLVDIQGTATPLTPDNQNLFITANIFKAGTVATIIPAVYTAQGEQNYKVDIVDGGAYYQTVLEKLGYASAGFPYNVGYESATQSNSALSASVSSSSPWTTLIGRDFYALLTGSSTTQGNILTIGNEGNDYDIVNNLLYNKRTSEYVSSLDYTDSYLPIRYGDFIRFGTQFGNYPLDTTFRGASLSQIVSIQTGSEILPGISSSITITPALGAGIRNRLNDPTDYVFRIFRRIPSENFVVVKNLPQFTDPGFLIPFNFNPEYNVFDLAKKAGLL